MLIVIFVILALLLIPAALWYTGYWRRCRQQKGDMYDAARLEAANLPGGRTASVDAQGQILLEPPSKMIKSNTDTVADGSSQLVRRPEGHAVTQSSGEVESISAVEVTDVEIGVERVRAKPIVRKRVAAFAHAPSDRDAEPARAVHPDFEPQLEAAPMRATYPAPGPAAAANAFCSSEAAKTTEIAEAVVAPAPLVKSTSMIDGLTEAEIVAAIFGTPQLAQEPAKATLLTEPSGAAQASPAPAPVLEPTPSGDNVIIDALAATAEVAFVQLSCSQAVQLPEPPQDDESDDELLNPDFRLPGTPPHESAVAALRPASPRMHSPVPEERRLAVSVSASPNSYAERAPSPCTTHRGAGSEEDIIIARRVALSPIKAASPGSELSRVWSAAMTATQVLSAPATQTLSPLITPPYFASVSVSEPSASAAAAKTAPNMAPEAPAAASVSTALPVTLPAPSEETPTAAAAPAAGPASLATVSAPVSDLASASGPGPAPATSSNEAAADGSETTASCQSERLVATIGKAVGTARRDATGEVNGPWNTLRDAMWL